jgi:hypothetical protein
MKPIFTLFIFAATGLLQTFAQPIEAERILKVAERQEIPRFEPDSIADNQLFLEMPYASSRFVGFPGGHVFYGLSLEGVDLVYTDYPINNDQEQYTLNKRRIQNLATHLAEAKNLPAKKWRIFAQTDCKTRAQAQALPHGFLLTFDADLELADFTDVTELEEYAEEDSTVLNALERNKNWRDMLVVADLTGSMAPYVGQLLIWFQLMENTEKVEHVVFFNDGDDMTDSLKVIGKTGGMYSIQPNSFEDIARLANRVAIKGDGGDEPENNIEALLYGLQLCPDCEQVVMISDNWASPRDLELVGKLEKPIRIILCGTEEGINVDYLNLARRTGGSVHTIEEDLYNLIEVSEGEEVKIGNEVFVIRNGKFELLRRI